MVYVSATVSIVLLVTLFTSFIIFIFVSWCRENNECRCHKGTTQWLISGQCNQLGKSSHEGQRTMSDEVAQEPMKQMTGFSIFTLYSIVQIQKNRLKSQKELFV